MDLATFSQFNFVVDAASVRQWALATFDADAGSVGHESPDLELLMFFRSTGEVPDTIEDDSIGYGGAMAAVCPMFPVSLQWGRRKISEYTEGWCANGCRDGRNRDCGPSP